MGSSLDAEKAEVTNVEAVGTQDDSLIHHPKNWHWSLKAMILTNICFMVFCGNFYSAGISSGLGPLVSDFHSNYSDMSDIVSYSVLCFGIGSFVWIPSAVVIGKRPVLLASQLMFMFGCIWATQATSVNSLLGSRILGALGAGAVQAVGPAAIGEVFFERDYSKAMSSYSACLCFGSQLGPLIAGHLIEARSWRWFFILLAILSGCNFVSLAFFCPETAFKQVIQPGSIGADIDSAIRAHSNNSKPRPNILGTLVQNTFYTRHPHVRGGGMRQWVISFLLQIEYMIDPIVLLSAGIWGIALAWVAAISIIANPLFAAPPFNWGSAEIGNWGATTLVGVVIAFPIAGPLTDYISSTIGKRRGKHMPEYRLATLIVPILVCSPGLLLFGYTYPKGSYVGPAIGYSMETASLLLIPSTVLSYAIDSYPYDSSEVVALINAVTHLIPFGLTKTAANWLSRVGAKDLFVQMAAIQWAVFIGLSLALMIFGPYLRTKAIYFHAKYGAKRFL